MTTEHKPTGRAIGGIASRAKLTPEERSASASKAALAKAAMSKLPKATHSGEMKIGDLEIQCFVLDDGRRVISGRGLTSAIGMKGRGQGVSRISTHKLINFNENKELVLAIENPIKFVGKSPKGANEASDGYEAKILQEVCEALLLARDKGIPVTEQDRRYVLYADTLIRAFARVGIIALVDEATGYQKDRAKDALAKILEAYVAKELQPWVKTFDANYYEGMFRLRGLPYPPETKNLRPQYFGKLTNDIVYRRLAPGVLAALKTEGAKAEKRGKLHQHLTAGYGRQELLKHLGSVTTMMRLSKDWPDFMDKLNQISPRFGDSYALELEEPDR